MDFSAKDLFKHSYCITTSDELYGRFSRRMVERGLPRKLLPGKFTGLYPKCIMSGKDNMQMCILSHFSLIHMASLLNWQWITIFEDDALPRKDFFDGLQDYLKNGIPNDPSMVMWGQLHFIDITSQINGLKFASIRGHLFGTHAYTVFKKGYAHYLNVNRISQTQINPDWTEFNFPTDTYVTSKSFFIQFKNKLQYPNFLMDGERVSEFT